MIDRTLMIEERKSYRWSLGYRCALVVAGALFLGCAYGTWTVNAPKTGSTRDWALLIGFEALFVGVGLLMIGYRMQFSVLPRERKVVREKGFFGILTGLTTWDFSDFSSVELARTSPARRGARAAVVRLRTRVPGDPIVVNSYPMVLGAAFPDQAVSDANELAQTLQIPFQAE